MITRKGNHWPIFLPVALYAYAGRDGREGAVALWKLLGLRHCLGPEPFTQVQGEGFVEACPLTPEQWDAWKARRDLGAIPDGLAWHAGPNGGKYAAEAALKRLVL